MVALHGMWPLRNSPLLTDLLLTKLEVCTWSYEPIFFPDLWPKHEARKKNDVKQQSLFFIVPFKGLNLH